MCTFQILAAYVGDGKGAWMKRRIQWYYPRGGPEAGAKGEVKVSGEEQLVFRS